MGKTLKEALEEHLAALRAQGLAPRELPRHDDSPAVVVGNGAARNEPSGEHANGAAPRRRSRKARGKGRRGDEGTSTGTESAAKNGRGPSVNEVLRRRAAEKKQAEELRSQIAAVLQEINDGPMSSEAMDEFLRQLGEEVGVLPPLPVVLHALNVAKSTDIRAVGDAVRQYYRQPRRKPGGS